MNYTLSYWHSFLKYQILTKAVFPVISHNPPVKKFPPRVYRWLSYMPKTLPPIVNIAIMSTARSCVPRKRLYFPPEPQNCPAGASDRLNQMLKVFERNQMLLEPTFDLYCLCTNFEQVTAMKLSGWNGTEWRKSVMEKFVFVARNCSPLQSIIDSYMEIWQRWHVIRNCRFLLQLDKVIESPRAERVRTPG